MRAIELQRGATLGPDPGLHLVPDVGAQSIAFEVIELERLLVLERQGVELESHPEPVAQEEPGGVGEEGDQIREIDDTPGVIRRRQRHACEAGRGRRRLRPHDLRRLAHAAGIAEQALAGARLAARRAVRRPIRLFAGRPAPGLLPRPVLRAGA